jgi:cell wall-associated NlpC family hydrolase
MDCSSYVQRVYKIFGIDLPRTAREQFRMGYTVAKNALQVGDLVFFKRAKSREPTHVGIYLGDDKYIHTSLTKRQVEIDALDGRYAKLHFVGAKRIEEIEVENRRPDSEGE